MTVPKGYSEEYGGSYITRDMCLVVFGVDNVRRLRDTDFDTAPLGESDWDEEAEGVPPKFIHFVRPVTQLEKVYLIENCKLAQISR